MADLIDITKMRADAKTCQPEVREPARVLSFAASRAWRETPSYLRRGVL